MAVAQSTELRSRRLTGRIGAEISGVDLARLDDGDVAAIRRELLAHRVVFFRNQSIGATEQIAFASRLGPLTLGHPTLPQLTEERELFDLDSIAGATREPLAHRRHLRRASPHLLGVARARSSPRSAATPCGPTRWPVTRTFPMTCASWLIVWWPCTPTDTTTAGSMWRA